MTKKARNTIPVITLFAVIIVITAVGLKLYNDNLRNELTDQVYENLDEVKEQQQYNFENELKSQVDIITTTASMLARLGSVNGNHDNTISALNEVSSKTKFEFMVIANLKGESINSNGDVINISGRPYFESAIKGETSVSDPTKSLLNDDIIIPISAPLISDGKVVAVLMGAFSTDKFNQLLFPTYSGDGYAFVVNGKGDVIAGTENGSKLSSEDNIFALWEKSGTTFHENRNKNDILADMKQEKDGTLWYKRQQEICIAKYTPLGINNWYIFVGVPNDIISQNSKDIMEKAGLLTLVIVTLFVLITIYIFIIQAKSVEKDEEHIRQLEKIAFVDELTGARNYSKFKNDAQSILETNNDSQHILVKIDIENFKLINKMYGFELGNHILITMARAIECCLVEDDEIFGRMAIDEFLILHNFHGVQKQLERRQAFFEKFYELMGPDFNYKVKFKLGQYVINKKEQPTSNIKDLFELVNFAHKEAKQSTTTDVVFYDESMAIKALKQKEIENQMEKALINNEFLVYLQPKYRLRDETIVGAEALVRWRKSDGSLVYPNDFIPVFEKNGFVTKLDMYMLTKVCSLIKSWIDNGIEPVTVSVNFSRLHLNKNDFVDNLCKTVDSYGISRSFIEIEITETVIFENLNAFKEVLISLHRSGFTLSMDDFGSGYSSLGLLKNLPVDVIKIDRSFFANQADDKRTITVVANVIRMADELSIHTVAEGIEDKVYIDLLCRLGCDMVQGYYYAKPMPEEEFTQKLIDKSGCV